MRLNPFIPVLLTGAVTCCTAAAASAASGADQLSKSQPAEIQAAQVPDWSRSDLADFLHGSMSTEFVPEVVLRAFIEAYPELFPTKDLSDLGLIPDPVFGWPVGFSRSQVGHLGGLSSVGINCAACHVGDVSLDSKQVRVLGMTSLFDAEGFFRAVLGASFQSAVPENMRKFLAAYLRVNSSGANPSSLAKFEYRWEEQADRIRSAMAAPPATRQELPPGGLHTIAGDQLRLDADNVGTVDLADLSQSMLHLFHNMRAALHVPD